VFIGVLGQFSRKLDFALPASDLGFRLRPTVSFSIPAQFAVGDGRDCDDRAVRYDADFLAGHEAERSQPFAV
jgi:hypothetical protein